MKNPMVKPKNTSRSGIERYFPRHWMGAWAQPSASRGLNLLLILPCLDLVMPLIVHALVDFDDPVFKFFSLITAGPRLILYGFMLWGYQKARYLTAYWGFVCVILHLRSLLSYLLFSEDLNLYLWALQIIVSLYVIWSAVESQFVKNYQVFARRELNI